MRGSVNDVTNAPIPPIPLPPEHVRTTFGLRDAIGEPAGPGWDRAWRFGDVVLSPVADYARAAWSAKARETLRAEGVRLARPVRSSDGRYVVSGWRADTAVVGEPQLRVDEVLSLASRLHAATAALPRPRFLERPPALPWDEPELFAVADRSAWAPDPVAALRPVRGSQDPEPRDDVLRAQALLQDLAELRQPVTAAPQIVHGDLLSTSLFSGSLAPGLADLIAYWRPPAWGSAVVVVDALAWGGESLALIQRWDHLPEWGQMLLRALMFRLAVHVIHPDSRSEAFTGLEQAEQIVRHYVEPTRETYDDIEPREQSLTED